MKGPALPLFDFSGAESRLNRAALAHVVNLIWEDECKG